MSRRLTLSVICDTCGRISEHELLAASALHNGVYTTDAGPKDWDQAIPEGSSNVTPRLDYCPACKPRKK